MNIKNINIPIHQLLFGLLITSGLPGLTNHSVLFESIDLKLKLTLYAGSLFLRELFIFLIGIKITLIILKKINIKRIKYITFIAILPILPILFLLIFDFNLVLIATGIRFYILLALPLFILEDTQNFNFKKNILINDYIVYFYLFLNILTYLIGYEGFSRPGLGDTFLGVRYPFIFDNPIIAAQQFGIFLVYFNFRSIISKSLFEKKIFLLISIFILIMCFYTGGRAGIVVSLMTILSTIIIYLFPKYKYIFLTPRKTENKLFIIGILFACSIFFVTISSNPLISGRIKTQQTIEKEGVVSGVLTVRKDIFIELFQNFDIDKIIGKPGKGTNTACNTVISDYKSEECKKTDALLTSSIFSFGVIGFFIYFVIILIAANISYSPLMVITFIVYSLSQIFPEIILPWTQFVLILFHSNQQRKLKISNFKK